MEKLLEKMPSMLRPDFYSQNTQPPPNIWTVSQLNRAVAHALDVSFMSVWVKGEIRGFTQATSGHWYFTLKDAGAEVQCAMFASSNRHVTFRPKTGDHVEVRARVSLYVARGSYQLVVEEMRHEGLGTLYAQFLALKAKLQAEGLFAFERKKPIPRLNFKIAVVTSLKAAALRDVIKTLRLNAPYASLTVYPAAVQGVEAPPVLMKSLRLADASDAGVILLVRGGGSIEDLWAFNNEQLARCIASLSKPIIVGVGHESDETIADYVADLHAATPTAAALAATAPLEKLLLFIQHRKGQLDDYWSGIYQAKAQLLDSLTNALVSPKEKLYSQAETLRRTMVLLQTGFSSSILKKRYALQWAQSQMPPISSRIGPARQIQQSLQTEMQHRMQEKLSQLKSTWELTRVQMNEVSPERILSRGFVYTSSVEGAVITSAQKARQAQELVLHWHDGVVPVIVKNS